MTINSEQIRPTVVIGYGRANRRLRRRMFFFALACLTVIGLLACFGKRTYRWLDRELDWYRCENHDSSSFELYVNVDDTPQPDNLPAYWKTFRSDVATPFGCETKRPIFLHARTSRSGVRALVVIYADLISLSPAGLRNIPDSPKVFEVMFYECIVAVRRGDQFDLWHIGGPSIDVGMGKKAVVHGGRASSTDDSAFTFDITIDGQEATIAGELTDEISERVRFKLVGEPVKGDMIIPYMPAPPKPPAAP